MDNEDKLDLSCMGPIFKQARLDAKLTQEELGDRVNKTARYLQAVENEGRSVSLDTFLRIVRALHISADLIAYHGQAPNCEETDELLRVIMLLGERDRQILLATATEMLNRQKDE